MCQSLSRIIIAGLYDAVCTRVCRKKHFFPRINLKLPENCPWVWTTNTLKYQSNRSMFHPGNKFSWNPYTWYNRSIHGAFITLHNSIPKPFFKCCLCLFSLISADCKLFQRSLNINELRCYCFSWIYLGYLGLCDYLMADIFGNFLIGNNTRFYIRKVKPTCFLKHFSMICN